MADRNASQEERHLLQPLPPGPVVNQVEVASNRHIIASASVGALVGGLIAGPPGLVIGGGVAAVVAAGQRRSRVHGQEVWPYGIERIAVPRDGISESGGVVYYAIDVFPTEGTPWRVTRRYREFDAMRSLLRSIRGMKRHAKYGFPRKHFHMVVGERRELRRAALEAWLMRVLRVSPTIPNSLRTLRPFLENHRATLPSVTQRSPVSQAQCCQASSQLQAERPLRLYEMEAVTMSTSSGSSTLTPAPSSQGAGEEWLQFTMPEGASVGATVQVTGPNGKEWTCIVPDGASAGCQVILRTPSASSTSSSIAPCQLASELREAETSLRESHKQPGEHFQLQVPPSSQPGQVIAVALPGGVTLPLKLPSSAVPGGEVEVELDPVSQTITAVLAKGTETHAAGQGQETHRKQAEDSGPQLLRVQVPQGLRAGDAFEVEVPDGRKIAVTVPAGSSTCSDLQFKYQPKSGTLALAA
mmetsp:Transcript_30534/g.71292  ORF Transcript_30534/g.71292 Transcript_30534/m.71292 type:complete len:470 (+) Transcript_30534:89-1498(+)